LTPTDEFSARRSSPRRRGRRSPRPTGPSAAQTAPTHEPRGNPNGRRLTTPAVHGSSRPLSKTTVLGFVGGGRCVREASGKTFPASFGPSSRPRADPVPLPLTQAPYRGADLLAQPRHPRRLRHGRRCELTTTDARRASPKPRPDQRHAGAGTVRQTPEDRIGAMMGRRESRTQEGSRR
jgi:hypothetical protein